MGVTIAMVGDMKRTIYDTEFSNMVDRAEGVNYGSSLPAAGDVGDVFYLTTDGSIYIMTAT